MCVCVCRGGEHTYQMIITKYSLNVTGSAHVYTQSWSWGLNERRGNKTRRATLQSHTHTHTEQHLWYRRKSNTKYKKKKIKILILISFSRGLVPHSFMVRIVVRLIIIRAIPWTQHHGCSDTFGQSLDRWPPLLSVCHYKVCNATRAQWRMSGTRKCNVAKKCSVNTIRGKHTAVTDS